MVVAFIALLLALAGTAYAGVEIGANSVGTTQLRDGSVTTSKLHNGAVTSAKTAGCGAGKVKLAGGCVEVNLRAPQGYSTAVATCAKLSGRLPFISELTALASLGKPLGNPELVADVQVNGRHFEQTVLFADGRVATEDAIDSARRFRCVTPPV
jgi:hypothetical protein